MNAGQLLSKFRFRCKQMSACRHSGKLFNTCIDNTQTADCENHYSLSNNDFLVHINQRVSIGVRSFAPPRSSAPGHIPPSPVKHLPDHLPARSRVSRSVDSLTDVGRIGSGIRVSGVPVSNKNARLVGRLGSGHCLVCQTRSGVRASASFQKNRPPRLI